jgi:hypothetical protein
MDVSLETAQMPAQLSDAPDHREIRIRFESRTALIDGFALARKESWIEDCHMVLPRRELVIRMAGGFSIDPGQGTAPCRSRRGAMSLAS